MIDFYGLPRDFPGLDTRAYGNELSAAKRVAFLEARFREDIGFGNFQPHLVLHEFEALLFSQPEKFEIWANTPDVVEKLILVVSQYDNPEAINDGQDTAPSKRVKQIMPDYQKADHGPLIADDIGLDRMRALCPHFSAWLSYLDSLCSALVDVDQRYRVADSLGKQRLQASNNLRLRDSCAQNNCAPSSIR